MEKPIVFLSHSTFDKAPLFSLKEILDERAAGSLNFFLSSDGESIRFGRNWVVKVSDALVKAKLMFVFLSAQSADSKWIHFEAGCAYAMDTQVVPVCLPGIDLNRITAPLSLLQGFNLHSHEALGNLARICNDTFDLKLDEKFIEADFDRLGCNIIGLRGGFFGEQAWTIDSIDLTFSGVPPAKDFNPIFPLVDICTKEGLNCHSSTKAQAPSSFSEEIFSAKFELPGCLGEFHINQPRSARNVPDPEKLGYKLRFTLSAEMFHVNAPLLDQWLEKANLSASPSLSITFARRIICEQQRHRLTTKLYQCGINLAGLEDKGFEFDGFKFFVWTTTSGVVHFVHNLAGKIADKRLSLIVGKLFSSGVLWEREAFSDWLANAEERL